MTRCRGTRKVSSSGRAPGTTLRWKAGARILSEHPAREVAAGGDGGQGCSAAARKVRSPAAGARLERGWSGEPRLAGGWSGLRGEEPGRDDSGRRDKGVPEGSGHRSAPTPRDVPAVRRTVRRVRRGFGDAPGGAATPRVHRTRKARFRLFLKRAAEPSRAKPSLMPARERVNGLLESALPHTTGVSQNRPAEAQTRRASSP